MKINFRGKKIPIRISYYAIKMFQEETKKSLDQIGEDLSLIEILVWYAIIAGYKAEGRDIEIEREDVVWLLDESLTDIMAGINNQNAPIKSSKKK